MLIFTSPIRENPFGGALSFGMLKKTKAPGLAPPYININHIRIMKIWKRAAAAPNGSRRELTGEVPVKVMDLEKVCVYVELDNDLINNSHADI
jgi:hypothetical protein